MNKIIQIAIALCIGLILVFNSCKQEPLTPHLKAIPDDASFVVVFENKKLISKGGLNNFMDFNFIDQFVYVDEATKKLIAEFTKNPKSFGIDIDQTYLFGVQQEVGFFVAMVFKIDKASTFEANIKKLTSNRGNDISVVVNETYKITNIDKVTLVWNNDLLFVDVSNTSSMVEYDRFFNMPKEKNITNVQDFVDFNDGKYDIGFWGAYNELLNLTESFAGIEQVSILKELSGLNFHIYLNFENGEMKLSLKATPKSKMTEFFNKYPIIGKNFDNILLRAFPEKTYLVLKQSLDIPELINILTEISEQTGKTPSFEKIFENPEVSDIINVLGGDIILSVYGFAQGPLPLPLASVAFNVKSEADFNNLLKKVPKSMVTRKGDYYVVSFGMMISVYFTFKDNNVYVTYDEEAIKTFIGNGFEKSLNSTEISKNLFHFYINLDSDSYPEDVQAMMQNEIGSYIGEESLNHTKLLKEITLSMDEDFELVFLVKFVDSRQNSLKQIINSL